MKTPIVKTDDDFHFVYPIALSLRDWFAGQALAGQLASLTNRDVVEKIHEIYGFDISDPGNAYAMSAASAYRYADAMLAQREKQE